MDYQRIKCFLKAAETLNFSEAARQLYITPQAFGKQIGLLEQEMGFPLFERSTRQTRLTVAGKMCYERLAERFYNLEKEYDRVCEVGKRDSRRIRIGVFSALSRKKVVTPIVSKIMSQFPDRDISINMYDMGELQKALHNGTMDLCIMTTHDREVGWDDCIRVVLRSEPSKVVISDAHIWASRDDIMVEDMEREYFTRMNQPQYTPNDYYGMIPCKEQIVVENNESMYLELDKGSAFTIMPFELDRLSEQNYVAFDMPWSPFSFDLVLIYRKEDQGTFVSQICQTLLDKL